MTIKQRVLQWLRFTERYTKTDMLYLASGGFWLTAGQTVASLSAFVLSIVFANFLTPQVYGTYKYILSLGGIFSIPTLTGISTALQRAIARGEDRAALRALRAKLLGGSVATLGAGAAAAWYFANGNQELGIAFIIVAIGTPLMEAYGIYDSILQGKGLFRKTTLYFATSSLCATFALTTAILLSGGSLIALLAAYFGTWAVTRIIAWRLASRFLTHKDETVPGEAVSYGVRLSAISIVSMVAGNIDKIILFQWLGPTELAVYSFATAIPEQLRAVLKGITPLALSRFSRRSAEEIQSAIHTKAIWLAVVALPIIGAYIITAPYIYEHLFPAYIEAVIYSQVFALSLVLAPAYLYNAAFQSQRSEKLIATSEIVLSGTLILMLLVFIPFFGIWGAILARVISRSIGTLFLAFLIKYL